MFVIILLLLGIERCCLPWHNVCFLSLFGHRLKELKTMANRIMDMRAQLKAGLIREGTQDLLCMYVCLLRNEALIGIYTTTNFCSQSKTIL